MAHGVPAPSTNMSPSTRAPGLHILPQHKVGWGGTPSWDLPTQISARCPLPSCATLRARTRDSALSPFLNVLCPRDQGCTGSFQSSDLWQ